VSNALRAMQDDIPEPEHDALSLDARAGRGVPHRRSCPEGRVRWFDDDSRPVSRKHRIKTVHAPPAFD
jgi:hypothetical protein